MYYTGISVNPLYGSQPDSNQDQSYFNLNQDNYNVPQPTPVQQSGVQNYNTKNPVTNTKSGPAPVSSTSNVQYAKNIDELPSVVEQASQKYLGGTSGYGDPSQSLFGRNLTRQYNQWESQYEKPGEEFVPWALGAGGYDPSQVDLFNPLLSKDPTLTFNKALGRVDSQNDYLNPLTGDQYQGVSSIMNPTYGKISNNYKDFNQNYLGNLFGEWTKAGVTGLPSAKSYLAQAYANANPYKDPMQLLGASFNALNDPYFSRAKDLGIFDTTGNQWTSGLKFTGPLADYLPGGKYSTQPNPINGKPAGIRSGMIGLGGLSL